MRALVASIVIFAITLGGCADEGPSGPPPLEEGAVLEVVTAQVSGVVGEVPEERPSVRVLTSTGDPLAGAAVLWRFGDRPGSADHSSTSGDDGIAIGEGPLDLIAGAQTISASLENGAEVAIAATAEAGPVRDVRAPALVIAEVGVATGSDIALTDAYGNDVRLSRGSWSIEEAALGTVDGAGAITGALPGVGIVRVTVDDTVIAVPLEVRPLLRLVQIEAGLEHACGLTEDGEAYCWGSNGGGRLGAGHDDPVDGAARVAGPVRFAELTLGQAETCGLAVDGTGYCWGTGRTLLGDSVTTTVHEPTPIALGEPLATIDIGWHRGRCVVTILGDPYCWGHNDFGQIGQGFRSSDVYFPVPLPVDTTVLEISMSGFHGCARLASERTWCWGGLGGIGRVDTTATSAHLPAPIAGDYSFKSVDSGLWTTCALDAAGGAFCWGHDFFLNYLGATSSLPEPTAIPNLTFHSLAVGWGVLCGVLTSGIAKCWSSAAEMTVELPGSEVAQVVAGSSFTFSCAVDLEGAPYCWSLSGEDEFPATPTRLYARLPTDGDG